MPIFVKYDSPGTIWDLSSQVGKFKGGQLRDAAQQNWTRIGNQASHTHPN